MFDSVRKKLASSPAFKTFINIISIVIAGVLCSAFIVEITVNGKLEWINFYKAKSFYGLLIFAVLIYIYYKFLFFLEKDIANFKDDEYCRAYMRKECLPELAKQANKLIKSGQNTEELKALVKDLKL